MTSKNKTLLTRRRLLQTGAAASLSLAMAPRAVFAATPERSLSFYNLHTGESLNATFWADGGYVPAALTDINHVLRDFRTDQVMAIDPKLLDLLFALRGRMDTKDPFHVISGYRSPATNAMLHEHSSGVAAKSFHTKGMAIDINVPNRSLSDLHRVALSMSAGGVGYYPSSDFVHVDTGPVRRWG